MKIRSKLAWTYNILLIIGIITISAYAILTIRAFLLEEGLTQFENDIRALSLAIGSFLEDEEYVQEITREVELYGYDIALFDTTGGVFYNSAPDSVRLDPREHLNQVILDSLNKKSGNLVVINDRDFEKLIGFTGIKREDIPTLYLRVSQHKGEYYAAVSSIRHIIYGGMIFSVGAVIIVSFVFARYMSKPILQLNEAALKIAKGDHDEEIVIRRGDEFGTLANSLNKMAGNLKADNEKLKALNEKQNQFFADIAHEVRNPLHTISGAMEMLQLESLDAEKKAQYMATAQKQIERVVRLFEDIKSLQRYDMDESFIKKTRFDISEVVADVVNTYKPIASEKGLILSIGTNQSAIVEADPDKMEQVLDNLISNAIKYTVEGEVKVSCTTTNREVLLEVADTGIGIGEEHLDRLFDRFYRTDKARSRDKGGTGLGLAVVKGILNAHQREIFVESRVSEGSRFYFTLPTAGA